MSINVMYASEHLWVRLDDEIAEVGVTKYGLKLLGEIAFVELPDVGSSIECGQCLCIMESTKIAAMIGSPCRGKIADVNEDLLSRPELINNDSYQEVWLVKIKYDSLKEGLMTAEEYNLYLKG